MSIKMKLRAAAACAIMLAGQGTAEVVHTLVLQGNHLWVGTDKGAVRWNIASLAYDTYSQNESGLSNNDITTIVIDRKGNPWFGTKGGGVCSEAGFNEWKCYMELQGVISNFIYCGCLDKEGNLWFGSNIKGVAKYSQGKWQNVTTADGLLSNAIRYILRRANGDLWFSTDKGIAVLSAGKWSSLTSANGLVSDDVRGSYEDRQGNVWVACGEALGQPGGVAKYEAAGTWKFYSKRDGIGDNDVYCVSGDDQGRLWCGTYGGISRFDGTAWTSFNFPDSPLVEEWVYDLKIDQNGSVWLGTSKGLYRYDGGRSWSLFEAK